MTSAINIYTHHDFAFSIYSTKLASYPRSQALLCAEEEGLVSTACACAK